MAKKTFKDITTGQNRIVEESEAATNTNLVEISKGQFEKEQAQTKTPDVAVEPSAPPSPVAPPTPTPSLTKKTAANGFGSGVGASEADKLRQQIFKESQKVETFDDIKKRTTKRFQSEIDAVNEIFDQLVGEAQRKGAERLRGSQGQARAISASRGILGTARGAAQKEKVTRAEEAITKSEVGLIQSQRQDRISSLLGQARKSATDELKEQIKAKKAGVKTFLEFLDKKDERRQGIASSLVDSFIAQGIGLEELSEEEKDRVSQDLGVSRDDFETIFRGKAAASVKPTDTEDFTLKPGETRFNSAGEVVATGGVNSLSDIDKANLELTKSKIKSQNIKNEKDQASLNAVESGELNNDQRKEALSLSKAVTGNDSYKDMLDIQTGLLGVISGTEQDNGFGDIAAINAFQRMIDPGATVREGDISLLETASAFIERIAPDFQIDRLKKGDKLPQAVRDKMNKLAVELYDVRRNNYEDSIRPQRNLAESGGIDFGKFIATEFKTASELTGQSSSFGVVDIGGKINEAINEGFNPTEILDFSASQDPTLQTQIKEARENNFTDDEIIEFLKMGKTSVDGDTNQAVVTGTGNRPQRNQNPGNVKIGGVADKFALKDASGRPRVDDQNHLIFPNKEAGFKGLEADIKAKISGRSRFIKQKNPTIAQLGKAFAEDSNWSNGVARNLGVSPNTKTQSISFDKLINAIATQEGFFA